MTLRSALTCLVACLLIACGGDTGGGSGASTCSPGATGGSGSAGRIGVKAMSVSGTTNPNAETL